MVVGIPRDNEINLQICTDVTLEAQSAAVNKISRESVIIINIRSKTSKILSHLMVASVSLYSALYV